MNNKKMQTIVKLFKYIVTGTSAGIANGLFGSGGGTIVVPAMIFLLKAEDKKAHATAILIILPLTIVSAFFYISNNYVDWSITIKTMLGGMAGGYLGAKLLHICPVNILRKIFGIFMIAAAARMLI